MGRLREGVPEIEANVIIRGFRHEVSETEDLREPLERMSNTRVVRIHRMPLVRPHSHEICAVLSSHDGVARLEDKAKGGGLVLQGGPVRVIPEKRNKSEGRIWFAASTVSSCVTLEPNLLEIHHRLQPPAGVAVDFDFIARSLVWLVADPRLPQLSYAFQLSFRHLLAPLRFFSDPNRKDDILMAFRALRRPVVSYSWRQASTVPAEPLSPYAIPQTTKEGLLTPEELVVSRRKRPARGSRLAVLYFYSDYSESPTQNCDTWVLRFPSKRIKFQQSPLFRLLQGCQLLPPLPSDWEVRNRLNSITRSPRSGIAEHLALGFAVRWRVNVLLSHDLISWKAYTEKLLPILSEYLRDHGASGVCSALDRMAGQSKSGKRYRDKMFDSELEEQFFCELRNLDDAVSLSQTNERRSCDDNYFCLVPHIAITPSKAYCTGPILEKTNRMIREFAHRCPSGTFTRVAFRDEGLQPFYARDDGYFSARHIDRVLRDGVKLFGERFDFVMFGQSQLKSLSCWFIRRPTELERTGNEPTPEHLRSWMATMSEFRMPSKCAARMGLSLSTTHPASDNIGTEDFVVEDDVATRDGHFSLTDGCGKIAPAFADEVAMRMNETRPPSCFQVRFRGSKGTLVVYPTPRNTKIALRKSMRKHEIHAATPLEVCGVSKFRAAFLNREIINILSALRIADRSFEELQDEFLDEMSMMTVDKQQAIATLLSERLSSDTDWQRDAVQLFHSGVSILEPFMKRTLMDIRQLHVAGLRTKSRICVKDGALLYGVCDHSGTLNYGQVVVTIVRPGKLEGVLKSTSIRGKVVVTRNPCLHIGDIRVLDAVPPPSCIKHLENVIIFPVKGPRPHPSEMAGGDLDGDMYSIYWDPRLVPERTEEPMRSCSPSAHVLDRPVEIDDLMQLFVQYASSDNIGVIANAHKAWADVLGAGSKECRELAELASVAVDFAKTGVRAAVPDELRVSSFPDYMENPRRPAYKSHKVLGRLYRQIVGLDDKDDSRYESERVIDVRLLVDGHETFLPACRCINLAYGADVCVLMQQFGVRSESQLFAGAPLDLAMDPNGADRDVAEKLFETVRTLKAKYRAKFRDLYDRQTCEQDRLSATSAWYRVAYDVSPGQPCFRSFAWLAAKEMGDLVGTTIATNNYYLPEGKPLAPKVRCCP